MSIRAQTGPIPVLAGVNGRRTFSTRQHLSTLVQIALLLAVLTLVPACSSSGTSGRDIQSVPDIHERISDAIAQSGFSHRILSERNAGEHIDSIHLRIPLDGVKTRHEGVELLLRRISDVCALPEYANLPIRVVVATADELDGRYLMEVLKSQVAGNGNISFRTVVGSSDGVIITVNHPARGALIR